MFVIMQVRIAVMGEPIVLVPLAVEALLLVEGVREQRPVKKAVRSNVKREGEKQSVMVEKLWN